MAPVSVYRDPVNHVQLHIDPVELAVRGVVQVTLRPDDDPAHSLAVRCGPDTADLIAAALVEAAQRARLFPAPDPDEDPDGGHHLDQHPPEMVTAVAQGELL